MWHYEEEPVNGGAGGEVFRSIFNGSGLDAASRLAREAIQNSVDATRPGENPRITLEMKAYAGSELDRVWTRLGLDELAPREHLLRLNEGNALRNKPETLRVLLAKDSGTTGLSGDPTCANSKLRKLLMEIGGSQKIAEGKSSGGSYGFGKAVYSASSRIAVIFAYSRTEDHNGSPISLFMGCAYHTAHEFDGDRTSGRAFFGKPTQLKNAIRFDPFMGEQADDLARELNVERAEDDFGTTIAIVDCPLSMDDVRRGVERSWWPKIYRDNFKVKILDENGVKLPPRPLQDPKLRPFIEAINVALGRSPEKTGVSRVQKNFRPVGDGLKVGQLGLFVMKDEDLDEDEIETDLRDTIALVRSPGMVVQYYGKRAVNHPPVAGVFLADDDLDDILRRSEPPEHDRWDKNADRLDPTKDESNVVDGLHSRIWRELRSFQRSARPADHPTGNRLLQLERDLARLFGPTGKRSPIGEGRGETPISLKPKVFVASDGGDLRTKGVVKLGLKKEQPAALPVLLSLKLNAVDEAGHRVEPVELKVDFGPTDAVKLDDYTWRVRLIPGETIDISVESASYDHEWTVEFNPTVQPDDQGENV